MLVGAQLRLKRPHGGIGRFHLLLHLFDDLALTDGLHARDLPLQLGEHFRQSLQEGIPVQVGLGIPRVQ